jgi:integrase
MLNDAKRLYGLPSNPAEAVRPLAEVQDLEEDNALTPVELARMLVQLRKEDRIVAMAAWVQAFTGLRWGEVSALKWEDVDDGGQLTVRRTAIKGSLVPTTKTRRKRAVVLPAPLLEELGTYRNWLEVADHAGLPSGLMFPSESGKPLWASRMSDALKRARVGAKITRRFTSHGFRRTKTDLLRRAAVDPVTAKAITGHSTDRMRDHYSTVRREDLQQASDGVYDLMGPALAKAQQEARKLAHDEGAAEAAAKESTKESTAR